MKRNRHSEEQVITILKAHERAGADTGGEGIRHRPAALRLSVRQPARRAHESADLRWLGGLALCAPAQLGFNQ